MSDFIIPENPAYMPIRKFEVTDAAHADLFNCVTQKLINNDEFLKKETERNGENISDVELQFQGHCENTNLHVSENEKNAWNRTYEQSVGYTDKAIGDLINGAPETMDTLKEVADAIQENETIVEALNAAIGIKANEAEFSSHINNVEIHPTKNIIVNMLYPVGSIYQSSKPTNPGTLFGGTWQQIRDVVLVAAGSTFTAGATGGSLTHTLTIANMPVHNHAFTGTAVNTGSNSVTPSAAFTGTAVTSGSQSANHTHSVTAKGTISSDAHTHKVADVPGGLAALWPNGSGGTQFGNVVSNTGTKTTTSDSHKHTFTGAAVASGINSASHTHSVTAKGTVSLANTTHMHSVTAKGVIGNAGSGAAVNHMPPYKVMYVWERIA